MVSVIVPVYNVEMYLRQCLDSILAQTYKDVEVIMVDDGSMDSSGDICEEYAAKYDNFRVIHKKNAGLGMARNTGLEYITGEYVTFLDSDDYLAPACIEVLLKNMLEHKVDMCKGGFLRITNEKEILAVRKYENELFEGEKAKDELLPRMIGSSPSKHDSIEMCVCGAIYNVTPIKKYHIEFPSERELISEDMVFNVDYMQHAKGACTISDTGYCYRINMKSLTTSYRKDRFEVSRHFYLEMKKRLLNLGYDKSTILRLQRMFFVYLRTCIVQENSRYNALLSSNEHKKNILKMCNDDVVREIIREYPKKQLGVKQWLFLKLVEWRCVTFLFILSELGKI